MFAKWILMNRPSFGYGHVGCLLLGTLRFSTVIYIRLYWRVPFLFMSSPLSLKSLHHLADKATKNSPTKWEGEPNKETSQSLSPHLPWCAARRRTWPPWQCAGYGLSEAFAGTFKLDKSIDSEDAATSRITSSTSATVTQGGVHCIPMDRLVVPREKVDSVYHEP